MVPILHGSSCTRQDAKATIPRFCPRFYPWFCPWFWWLRHRLIPPIAFVAIKCNEASV